MTWREYRVHFHTDLGAERDDDGRISRFIRATSEADARWRVVRKFLLPKDATITSVERLP